MLNSSAIYLLRPTNKVHFQQADDDTPRGGIVGYCVDCGKSAAAIESFYAVLFGKLQQPYIVETLITLPETQLKEYFTKYVLDSDE